MRVLVTGADGQLGRDVVAAGEVGDGRGEASRADVGNVVDNVRGGITVVGVGRSELDITDAAAVERLVTEFAPDAVVNCAAFTAVDRCETESELAFAVNEGGVRGLAVACSRVGAHLLHVSTDYVFDGTLDRPYREDDIANPQSVYGRSKLAGERAAIEVLGDAVTIVRTSWVCGEHGENMVKLVRRLAAGDTPLAFVDDQRGRPTFTGDLARAIWSLVEQQPGGIVHVTNSGDVSWYGFVREILAASGHDPDRVRPIATVDLDPPRPAPRPANSILDDVRWRALGHAPLRDFREPLAELVARL